MNTKLKRSLNILTLFAFASAALTIRAEYLGPQYHIYLFKPLTIVFILLLALGSWGSKALFYKYAIVAGLTCSMAGDIFLMLPSDQFIAGLVSFLIAHIFYISAFSHGRRVRFSLWLLPFVLYGIVIFSFISPYLGEMKLPVLVYVGVILVMGWQALDRWDKIRKRAAIFAASGAVLFIISDSILAIDRFREQFDIARALILSSYFTAQWLIAMSVRKESQ